MSAVAQPPPGRSQDRPVLAYAQERNELDLLLAAAASGISNRAENRVRALLGRPLDWELVLSLAHRHGLIPALYQDLAEQEAAVPPEPMGGLRASYERNARQALWLTQLLCKMLECLESNGVEAVPYKGPVLAETLFQNVALRQYSDLDILIRAQDLQLAKIALGELGFSCPLQLSQRLEQAYVASGYEYVFDGLGNQNLIELQWSILPRFYAVDFDVEGFFSRTQSTVMADRTMQTLSPEDLFLVLCVHDAKHVWTRISWIRDIAQLAQIEGMDWDSVRKQARQLGIQRIVGVTMLLARDLLGAVIPAALAGVSQADQEAVALAAEVEQGIIAAADYDTESPAYFRVMIRLRERASDKLRFLTRLAFTPGTGEWSAVRLPDAFFPLYRAVRLFRLAGKLRPKSQSAS